MKYVKCELDRIECAPANTGQCCPRRPLTLVTGEALLRIY